MGRVKKEIKSTECGDYLRQKLEHQHYLNTASTRFNMRGGSSKSEKPTFNRLQYLDNHYRIRSEKGRVLYKKAVEKYHAN